MVSKHRIFSAFCGAVAIGAAAGAQAVGNGPVALLIPARQTMVELGFNVLHLRPVTMISYDARKDPTAPRMFVWDAAGRKWMPTDIEHFKSGATFAAVPAHVVIVAQNQGTADFLGASATWCGDVQKIPALDGKSVINALDARLGFTRDEWKWLAAREDLQIKDVNEPLRKETRWSDEAIKTEKPSSENPLVRWLSQPSKEQTDSTKPAAPAPQAVPAPQAAAPEASAAAPAAPQKAEPSLETPPVNEPEPAAESSAPKAENAPARTPAPAVSAPAPAPAPENK